MNSLDLNAIMHYDIGMKKISGGVWPADALLYLRCTRSMFLIVNTSKSNSVGSHWMALYLPSRGPIEFFLSLRKATLLLPRLFPCVFRKFWRRIFMEQYLLSTFGFDIVWRVRVIFWILTE